MAVFVATGISAHGILFARRHQLTMNFVKGLDYVAILSAAIGLSGAADLYNRFVQHEAPIAATKMKDATANLIREYEALRVRCNAPEIPLDYSEEQNEAIAKEWAEYERIGRNKLCGFVRVTDNPGDLLARSPFIFLIDLQDHARHADRPLKLDPLNRAIVSFLVAESQLRRFSVLPSVNESFSLEALGWMLIAVGFGVRLSRTTAEVFKWHV